MSHWCSFYDPPKVFDILKLSLIFTNLEHLVFSMKSKTYVQSYLITGSKTVIATYKFSAWEHIYSGAMLLNASEVVVEQPDLHIDDG